MYSGDNHAKRQINQMGKKNPNWNQKLVLFAVLTILGSILTTPECSKMVRLTISRKKYALSQHLFHQKYIESILAGKNWLEKCEY